MILLLDNRDSFTFNIAQALGDLGARVRVLSARDTDLATIRALAPERLVIGPGPGTPAGAGCSLAALRELDESLPILGLCRGHQALAVAWGGELKTSHELVHGQTRPVLHDGRGIFTELPNPFDAMRYNSLAVEESSLPQELEISARDEAGEIMALRHRTRPQVGIQFHPESILSDYGERIFAAFLALRAPASA